MIKFKLSKWLQLLGFSFSSAGFIGVALFFLTDINSIDPVIAYYFILIGTILFLSSLLFLEEKILLSGGQEHG